jgi:class 3 adenylate cyclase/ligand-binding sensor domain-containing protein
MYLLCRFKALFWLRSFGIGLKRKIWRLGLKANLAACFFFGSCYLRAQTARLTPQAEPRPFITNFSPKTYNAHNQNFCVTQDKRGIIYVGNGMGLLEFDGKVWNIVDKTKNKYIYSLTTDEKGKVFVGADNDLGYLNVGSKGKVYFQSLLSLLPKEQRDFGRVFRTLALGKAVYFQTENYIFCYRNQKLYTVFQSEEGSVIGYIYLVEGNLWASDDKGLFSISPNHRITRIKGTENINGILLPQVLKLGSQSYLLVNDQKLMLMANDLISAFNNEAAEYILQHRILDAVFLSDSTIAIATFTGGLIRVDKEGRLLNIFNKENDLIEDQTTSLFLDREGGLWVTTNNGISRIEFPSPLLVFNEKHNLKGVVGGVSTLNDKLYVATSQGVYVKSNSTTEHQFFRELKNTYFYSITSTTNVTLVSSNGGLFYIIGEQINRLIDLPKKDYFCSYTLPWQPHIIMVGSSNELAILDTQSGRPIVIKNITGLKGDIRSIVVDKKGKIWFGTHNDGVGCIEFSGAPFNFRETYKIKHFDLKDGLPSMQENVVGFLYDKLVLGTQKGLYSYNEKSNRFEQESMFGSYFNRPSCHVFAMDYNNQNGITCLLNIVETSGGQVEELYVIKPQEKNGQKFEITKKFFLRAGRLSINAVKVEDSGVIWVSSSEGLYRYDPGIPKNYDLSYKTLLRKVSSIKHDSLLFAGAYLDPLTRLISEAQNENYNFTFPYELNALRFEAAAPFFDGHEATLFQFFLEGNDEEWREWTKENFASYTNLSEGNYKLRVRAKNIYETISQEAMFSFTILPPWYRTWWAYILYSFFSMGAIYSLVRWRIRALEQENKRLELKVKERTAEVVQQSKIIEQKAEELQASYNNVTLLSRIGQELTASLDQEDIFSTLYRYINQLMIADVFGVFIYRPEENILAFTYLLENNERLESFAIKVDEVEHLSVWCLKNKKEILMEDYAQEYSLYISKISILSGKQPGSVIYVPLLLEDKILGVITVQSYRKKVYSNYHLDILRTLAAYTAIALDNANAYNAVEKQKAISDNLLLNILPADTAEELKTTGKATPHTYELVSVLFTDFKGFTKIAEKLSAEEIVLELDRCFQYFDEVMERHKMEKIKTLGDGYMSAGGIPKPNTTNAIDAVLSGLALQNFMQKINNEKKAKNQPYWELRLGIHTGPLVAGVVGKKKFAYDIWGDTVNTASRMESSGEAGKVNISHYTYELVKDFFDCTYRGYIEAKNKGKIEMYFVEGIKKELSLNGKGIEPNEKFWELYNKFNPAFSQEQNT